MATASGRGGEAAPVGRTASSFGVFLNRIRSRSRSPAVAKHSWIAPDPSTSGSADLVVSGRLRKPRSSAETDSLRVLPRSPPTGRSADANGTPRSPSGKLLFKQRLKQSRSAASRDDLAPTDAAPHERSRSVFGSLFQRVSGKRAWRRRLASQTLTSPDKRAAISEEDLVSKSLATELVSNMANGQLNKTPNGADPLAASLVASYHSQESVLVGAPRLPSYLRVSCALNGYCNYGRPYGGGTSGRPFQLTGSPTQHAQPQGKSLVERRLDIFESPRKEGAKSTAAAPCDMEARTAVSSLVKSFEEAQLESATERADQVLSAASDAACGDESASTRAVFGELTVADGDEDTSKAMSEERRDGSPALDGDDELDGAAYARLSAEIRRRLETQCAAAESHLDADIPSAGTLACAQTAATAASFAAADLIRVAVGKTRLLLRKKLAKFDELIDLNLNASTAERVVTPDDLDGYLQLVNVEVDDVEAQFAQVAQLRQSNWTPSIHDGESSADQLAAAVQKRGAVNGCKRASPKGQSSKLSSERDEERKRRIRAAKLARKQQFQPDENETKIYAK